MNALRLTVSQIRYVNKAFWRNPTSVFFTFAFPLMFLVIFTALLGHSTLHIGTRTVKTSTYYVAAMASFAVITACYNNIAVSITSQRDAGVLKRTNGTPLPAGSFLGARILHSLAHRDPARRDHHHVRPRRSTTSTSRPASPSCAFWSCSRSAPRPSAHSASRSPRSSRTPTPRRRRSTRPSCRSCSSPASSSRSTTRPRRGSSGSPASSPSGTSRSACRPDSSARHSTGPTSSSSPIWGIAGLALADPLLQLGTAHHLSPS